MNLKKNKAAKQFKRPTSSTVLYVGSVVVAIIGIAYLVTNIVIFKQMLSQYVTQGYPASDVINQLLPSQLLPGIYEPVAIYGGIALVLFGAGLINHKISKLLSMNDNNVKENIDMTGEEINITDHNSEFINIDDVSESQPDNIPS